MRRWRDHRTYRGWRGYDARVASERDGKRDRWHGMAATGASISAETTARRYLLVRSATCKRRVMAKSSWQTTVTRDAHSASVALSACSRMFIGRYHRHAAHPRY